MPPFYKFEDETPDQVRLTISTDKGYTAEFLRQLANAIEDSDSEFDDFENFRGTAKIEWP